MAPLHGAHLANAHCRPVPRSVHLPGGWLMSWHIRSVRARILLLVLVPVLSLFGLYLFTTGIAGKDALNLARARALKTATSDPVSNFLGQLDTERVYSVIYLSAPTPGQSRETARAGSGHRPRDRRPARRPHLGQHPQQRPSGGTAGIRHPAARRRGPVRPARLDRRTDVSRAQALATYNTLINDSYLLLNQVILTETSTPIAAQALALERIAKSGELLQQENVLVLGDMAGRRFPPVDQREFTRLAGARATLYAQTLPELDPQLPGHVSAGRQPRRLCRADRAGEHRDRRASPAVPARRSRLADWGRAVQGVSLGLERAGTQAASALDQQAEHEARSLTCACCCPAASACWP